MPDKMNIGRVMVPTADPDAAIKWYDEKLGFSLLVDVPFGEGDRWVEVGTSGGGASIALVPGRNDYVAPRDTGIALDMDEPLKAYEELKAAGVDCDAPIGGDGTVPALFFFRDGEGNQLMIVERPEYAG
jgi:catechol 2,3-dioxygenase-like lactoylglutathione lyase family enzyme